MHPETVQRRWLLVVALRWDAPNLLARPVSFRASRPIWSTLGRTGP
jgi:hypothetical protein